MIVKLRKIGNSTGVLLSKSIIEQCSIKDQVSLEVKGNAIIIQSVAEPRKGWAEAAQQMRTVGDDELLLNDMSTKFEEEEWAW